MFIYVYMYIFILGFGVKFRHETISSQLCDLENILITLDLHFLICKL